LKCTVSPAVTLSSATNPRMFKSPYCGQAPGRSHSPFGFPGFEFSQTMAFTGAAHGSTTVPTTWSKRCNVVRSTAAVSATTIEPTLYFVTAGTRRIFLVAPLRDY
jgi:hypothetical protein